MSGARRRGGWPIVALLLCCLPACAGRVPVANPEHCPVVPVDSARLGRDGDLRAQIEIRSHGQRVGFEVVSRARPDELIVVGLSPHGMRLFTVHQRGSNFEVEPVDSPMLEQVALWVMDALHRSRWIAVDGDAAQGHFDREGETLLETGGGGRRHREFVRAGSEPAVVGVTIDYSPPSASGHTERIEIRNEWCGYDASIVILDERAPEAG